MNHINKIYSIVVLAFILFLSFKSQKEPVVEPNAEEIAVPLTSEDLAILKYDSLLVTQLDSFGTVGAAVAIVDSNSIRLMKCYGVKQTGTNDSVNAHTIFRLASVSKAVSGVLAGKMLNERSIGLNDKIIDYLPDFKLKDSVNTVDLTVRHILSHTSGLVPHAYDNMIEAKVPLHTIIDSFHWVDISAKPGELYGYQNAVFSVFDTIACLSTSKCYAELLEEKVFRPFGMNDASSGYIPFEENKNKAFPHTHSAGGSRILSLNDRYYSSAPAAGVNASISDMAHLLKNLLKSAPEDTVNYMDTVFTPQVYTPLSRHYFSRWGKVDSRHYGLGWRIVGYKGKTYAYHGGYVRGYRAEIAFCKEENIGIVYLSNSPDRVASLSVPLFLNTFFNDTKSQENSGLSDNIKP